MNEILHIKHKENQCIRDCKKKQNWRDEEEELFNSQWKKYEQHYFRNSLCAPPSTEVRMIHYVGKCAKHYKLAKISPETIQST